MARARRCDLGCESWPDQELYSRCPECGELTTVYTNLSPLDEVEAASILSHREFERYYERYCVGKGQAVEGPLEPSETC